MPSLLNRTSRASCLLCICALLSACGSDDGTVTISGDVDGLDTLALRGDSLLAAADRVPSRIDSLRAVLEGRMPGSPPLAGDSLVIASAGTLIGPPEAPATGGAALTRRAQARGDSMARAAASRYAAGSGAGARSRADSMRGVIKLVGNAPALQAVLQVADAAAPVTLSGMATTGMQRLEGADVVVRGVRIGPRDIVVADYFVRSMNGMPAYDGILQTGDDGFALVLSDGSGRKRLTALPDSLRELSGTRVWVAMPDGSSAPRSFGYIGRR